MTDVSISLPAKRRRGRPRKDVNLSRETTLRSPQNPARINNTTPRPIYLTPDNLKTKNSKPDSIVGSMVYGVIEGSFDAGYLISVRVGNNDTPFRGVVFQPKKFVPVTTDNDVAPQATMYQRREFNVPSPIFSGGFFGPPRPQTASKQTVLRPVLPYYANHDAMMTRTSSFPNMGCGMPITPRNPMVGPNPRSPPVHPTDEAMQAFHVHGKLAEPDFGPGNIFTQNKRTGHHDFMKDLSGPAFGTQRGVTNDMYNFHQNLFSGQSQHEVHRSQGDDIGESVPKSLNLKLDLQTNYFIDDEPKSPANNNNLGYHHALVSGNPLLLPPEFSIGEPLDFMMGKNCSLPKSKKARQETSNEAVSSPSGPYKLELATPQSTVNEQTNINGSGGCITDMDFVLSDVVQGVEHQENVCEAKHR